jgi:hypothetical protein
MGWWGGPGDGGGPLWGDHPADILDMAIEQIVIHFRHVWGRPPTEEELRDGMEFSLGGYEEEEPAPFPVEMCCHCERAIIREACADSYVKQRSHWKTSLNEVSEGWAEPESMSLTCNGSAVPQQWHEPRM